MELVLDILEGLATADERAALAAAGLVALATTTGFLTAGLADTLTTALPGLRANVLAAPALLALATVVRAAGLPAGLLDALAEVTLALRAVVLATLALPALAAATRAAGSLAGLLARLLAALALPVVATLATVRNAVALPAAFRTVFVALISVARLVFLTSFTVLVAMGTYPPEKLEIYCKRIGMRWPKLPSFGKCSQPAIQKIWIWI